MSERKADVDPVVSRQMSRMPRQDSAIEVGLRRELHRRGLRFRKNLRGLPGTPDIAFTRARLAVFCDGCFWHGCPDHGVIPKRNRQWWLDKLDANRQRDLRKDGQLRALGWEPIHVWEHDDISDAADAVETLWWERTGRTRARHGAPGGAEHPPGARR